MNNILAASSAYAFVCAKKPNQTKCKCIRALHLISPSLAALCICFLCILRCGYFFCISLGAHIQSWLGLADHFSSISFILPHSRDQSDDVVRRLQQRICSSYIYLIRSISFIVPFVAFFLFVHNFCFCSSFSLCWFCFIQRSAYDILESSSATHNS